MKSDWRGILYNDDGSVHYSYVSACPYPFPHMEYAVPSYAGDVRDGKCTHQSTMYRPCTRGYICIGCGANMMSPYLLDGVKRCLMNGMRQMFEEMRNE